MYINYFSLRQLPYSVIYLFYNFPQAVAREKLDKIREENQSKTRKDYEMTISELKVGPLSRSNYFGLGVEQRTLKLSKDYGRKNKAQGALCKAGNSVRSSHSC